MTLEQVWQEINRLHRENDMFTAEQCRQVDALIDKANKLMATKAVKVTVKTDAKGKTTVKPKDTAPLAAKIARKGKADSAERRLRANREKSKR